MARIVRHRSGRFRSAPLSKHVSAPTLKREGVTRDGADARLFDLLRRRRHQGFCRNVLKNRHHFRPHSVQMADLRAFTRELMADAERDLGTTLDWVSPSNTGIPTIRISTCWCAAAPTTGRTRS